MTNSKINLFLGNKVKIVISALFFILLVVIILCQKEENEQIISIDKEKLYTIAEEYLINKEKENNSKLKVDDLQTFSEFAHLGINENDNEVEVYLWAMIESYYVENSNNAFLGNLKKMGYSEPYKFIFQDEKIISVFKPEYGNYSESIEQHFPRYIRDKFKDEIPVTSKNIDLAVSEHYSYLNNRSIVKTANPSKSYLIYVERLELNEILNHLNYISIYQPLPDANTSDYQIYFGDELEYTISITQDNDYYIIKQETFECENGEYAYEMAYLTWYQHNELEKILNKYFEN